MPCRPSTIRSALRSWPILRIDGSSSTGASMRQRFRLRQREAAAEAFMPKRDVARLHGAVDTARPTSVARTGAVPSVITFMLNRPAAFISAASAASSSVEPTPRSPSRPTKRWARIRGRACGTPASKTAHSSARGWPREPESLELERDVEVGAGSSPARGSVAPGRRRSSRPSRYFFCLTSSACASSDSSEP